MIVPPIGEVCQLERVGSDLGFLPPPPTLRIMGKPRTDIVPQRTVSVQRRRRVRVLIVRAPLAAGPGTQKPARRYIASHGRLNKYAGTSLQKDRASGSGCELLYRLHRIRGLIVFCFDRPGARFLARESERRPHLVRTMDGWKHAR